MVCHRFLTSLMSHFSPHSAIYELFCSVKRKEFQILTWCKFLFGIKGWRRWKGSTTNCHKAPINPSDIFWFTVKNKAPFKSCNPTFWIILGLSWAYWASTPSFQSEYFSSFPQALPCVSSPWLSCTCPKVLLCHLVFTAHVPAEEFPLLLPAGIQYWTGNTRGEIFWSFLRIKSPQQQSPVESEWDCLCSRFPANWKERCPDICFSFQVYYLIPFFFFPYIKLAAYANTLTKASGSGSFCYFSLKA